MFIITPLSQQNVIFLSSMKSIGWIAQLRFSSLLGSRRRSDRHRPQIIIIALRRKIKQHAKGRKQRQQLSTHRCTCCALALRKKNRKKKRASVIFFFLSLLFLCIFNGLCMISDGWNINCLSSISWLLTTPRNLFHLVLILCCCCFCPTLFVVVFFLSAFNFSFGPIFFFDRFYPSAYRLFNVAGSAVSLVCLLDAWLGSSPQRICVLCVCSQEKYVARKLHSGSRINTWIHICIISNIISNSPNRMRQCLCVCMCMLVIWNERWAPF